jgi:hypothetical protein
MEECCDRCKRDLSVLIALSTEDMTMGYYRAKGWADFCNPGEQYICDCCMFKDPRYIAVYGEHPC